MISLRYGKGAVLEPFLNRVYGAQSVRQLVLVSPWITHLEFLMADSRKLLQRLAATHTRLTIVTREPELLSEHLAFIGDAAGLAEAEIFFVPDLHAKYYV